MPRNKTHFDALLDEVQWMANDFVEERKWKIALAKKIAQEAVNYVEEMCSKKRGDIHAGKLLLRKKCSDIASQVKDYWNRIDFVKIGESAEVSPRKAIGKRKCARTQFRRTSKRKRLENGMKENRSLPLQARQKLHKMWSKNRDDLINDVSKPLDELVPSDFDAEKDARDSDSYMEDNDSFEDSDSSSEWEFEEAAKDDFDVESHRLYTDSDDTDDESWTPEDHGDEEGDDSYASDDDEAGGNVGKGRLGEDNALDAPKTTDDRLFSMRNKKEHQNATKSRLYQTASQASRFDEVNALCRDQMLPLEDALDMYLKNAGGDMEELLLGSR